jgi:hypothetical protein
MGGTILPVTHTPSWSAQGDIYLCSYYEVCQESKDTSHVGRQGIFYAYCGNTAFDLDSLPVSHARVPVVEPASFE